MEIGAVGNYKLETRKKCKCKKKGHISANCRSSSGNNQGRGTNNGSGKQITCHYCKKAGHKRPECRKLAKDKAEGNYKPSPNKPGSVKQLTEAAQEAEEDDGEWPSGDIVQAIFDPRPRNFWRRVDQEGSVHQ